MKIVDRKTFLTLPPKTVYQEYEPCFFGPINVKLETLPPNDWMEMYGVDEPTFEEATDTDTYTDCLDRMEAGESIPVFMGTVGRNGCFDTKKMYAIWDADDLAELIRVLTECKEKTDADPQV